ARGGVSALANFAPELVTGVYEAFAGGDLERARQLQFTLARVAGAIGTLPYAGAIKYLLERRGLPGGRTRAPQPELSPEQRSGLTGRLSAIPEVETWLSPIGERTRTP